MENNSKEYKLHVVNSNEPTNDKFDLSFNIDMSVRELKKKISKKKDIPVEDIILILAGKNLQDEKLIVSYIDIKGDTSIYFAKCNERFDDFLTYCKKGNVNGVKTYLNLYPYKLNLKLENEIYGFFLACLNKQYDVIDVLLEHPNLDINSKVNGCSPICLSVIMNNGKLLRKLVDSGIVDYSSMFHDQNALEIAKSRNRSSATSVLQNHFKETPNKKKKITDIEFDDFVENLTDVNVNELKKFIENYEFDINKCDSEKNNTLLTKACSEGLVDIVKFLLKVPGIDVNTRVFDNFTAIAIACTWDHLKVVKLILNSGFNVEMEKGYNRGTPLYRACRYKRDGIVKYLLEGNFSELTDECRIVSGDDPKLLDIITTYDLKKMF